MLQNQQYKGVDTYERGQYDNPDDMDTCSQCLKYLLFVFNLLFLIIGTLITGAALYILVDKTFVSDVLGNVLLTVVAWMVIIAGGLTVAVASCGCLGAAKENRTLLTIYCGSLLVLFAVFLSAGVMAFVVRKQIGEWTIGGMENTVQNYYGIDLDLTYNQVITQAWDKGQAEMYCCAVRDASWGVYRQAKWFGEQPGIEGAGKKYVPLACCKKDQHNNYVERDKCQTFNAGPPGKQSGDPNEALFYRGCYTAGKDWVWFYSAWLIGLAFGLGILLIGGILFSLCLLRRIPGAAGYC